MSEELPGTKAVPGSRSSWPVSGELQGLPRGPSFPSAPAPFSSLWIALVLSASSSGSLAISAHPGRQPPAPSPLPALLLAGSGSPCFPIPESSHTIGQLDHQSTAGWVAGQPTDWSGACVWSSGAHSSSSHLGREGEGAERERLSGWHSVHTPPLQRSVHILILGTCEWDLLWKKGLCQCD